jgi:N-acetylgalactosamine-6-sulfatase
MLHRPTLVTIGHLLTAVMLVIALPAVAAAAPPNVVIIFADDLGWGDLGCHGHPDHKTPHIDRLAADGIDLRQFSVAGPICSPSRAGLLTGRFPMRFRIVMPFEMARNIAIDQPDWLDPSGLTLPGLLRDHGYHTAIFGKWHLVEERAKVMADAPKPSAYGFLDWGLMRGPWDSAFEPRGSFDAAVASLRQPPQQPFLLVVTPHEPHVPYIASQEAYKANQHVDERARKYAASVTDLDRGVGRLLDTLRDQGLDDNTLVIFSSDNGPAARYEQRDAAHGQYFNAGSAGDLRGHKGEVYEGGVRTPFIARWPSHIPARTIDAASVVNAVDLLPTIAAAAGVALPPAWPGDGENRLAVLEGRPTPRLKPLFWRTARQEAVRDGDWKLVASIDGKSVELFNLAADPRETTDVAARTPAEALRLGGLLRDWRAGLPTTTDPACCSAGRTASSPPGRQTQLPPP